MDAVLQFVLTAAGFGLVAVLLRQWGEQRRAARRRMPVAQVVSDLPPAPVSPPPAEVQQALDGVRHQAVLLQSHVPPSPHARSYWGGRPRLAPGVVWPAFTAPDGTERSLSFLVQIACDEVPAGARLGVFPGTGVLQVFLDLAWGEHWRWRCLWSPDDPADLPEARLPETLPHAYPDRSQWTWPIDDADWPRLLPRWSFTPVLVDGDPSTPDSQVDDDDDDETLLWPGTIDLQASLQEVDGAVVDYSETWRSGPRGELLRPFASFPHDWRSVTIALGHLVPHVDRQERWPSGPNPPDAGEVERIRADIETWSARARDHAPDEALTPGESDEVWEVLASHRPSFTRLALQDAVLDSIDATLAAGSHVALPDEAIALVRSRHALATRLDGRLHVRTPDRMLAAPTCVQTEAWDRIAGGWLLLLEVSSKPGLGHEFGEGVLQFWIRPDDLAARRFDRVELTAEAY